eukprot:10192634-Lingulodinium_polyedra.AAC.1
MVRAARLTIKRSAMVPPATARQRAYWACQAYRAARLRDPKKASRALAAFSDLHAFFDPEF